MAYLYTTLVIIVSIAIKNIIWSQWERFKEQEALRETPMKLHKGVYVPWGRVQKIERIGRIILAAWAVWMIGLVAIVIYVKLFQ